MSQEPYSCHDHNQMLHLAWVLNFHLRPLTKQLGGRLDYGQPSHRSRLRTKTFGGVMVLCSTLVRYCFYPRNLTLEPASSIQLERCSTALFPHSGQKVEMQEMVIVGKG